jgi:polar amino acid transport system substrate-binding protein
MSKAPSSAEVVSEIAPTGRLRVAINLGNSVLAQSDPKTGAPGGVTVDLARKLGEELAVPVDLSTFDAAGKAFEALMGGAADIVFLAIDPVRAEQVAFTEPYVQIEGNFLVNAASGLHSAADIDRPASASPSRAVRPTISSSRAS